ncbi:MAG TPA: hypothetical protein VLE53_17325 [Gemmatimonadaceae bacterium]|nr:hypothetical protein [Gemmatimonadaceae bacterium]
MTTPGHPPQRSVHLSDRLWDVAAVLVAATGVALFAVARRALTALSAGTYDVPEGMTALSRADLHVAQSRFAIWLVTVGVLLGVVAALRHRTRAR